MLEELQMRQFRYTRSKFRRISSLDLIPEYPSQEESDGMSATTTERRTRKHSLPNREPTSMSSFSSAYRPTRSTIEKRPGIHTQLWWWPMDFLMKLFVLILRCVLFIPFSIAAPSFWLSALLWLFWKLIRKPIEFLKFLVITNPAANGANGGLNGQKRTVLISSGSTIQSLHLARNFYSSGARVVAFEFDGLFSLVRFSAAVEKFYVVPRPTTQNIDAYITALCHIVRKEKVSVYVPVCATSPAYYDAVVKPHLELLGCATFMTGIQETLILDDCLQFYQRCQLQNINVLPYTCISSLRELWQLYEDGVIENFSNIMVAVGMQGVLERFKYVLPRQQSELKFGHEISSRHQWLVVQDMPGNHYVTCTTIKNSEVIANVSCRIDTDTKNLVPVTTHGPTSEAAHIENWLKLFFAKVRFQRSINCHISFRLVKCPNTNELLPLGIRLGLSLPYICYNRSHAQILCRTMKCVHMRTSTFTISPKLEDTFEPFTYGTATDQSAFNVKQSVGEPHQTATALDKREALFAYWDPLPYCAYYHFQLPLESVKTFLQNKMQRTTKTVIPRLNSTP